MIDIASKINKIFVFNFITGSIILGLLAALSIIVIAQYFPDQNLAPTPLLTQQKDKIDTLVVDKPCEVGKRCEGPNVTAKDPEGDDIIYRFFDKTTNQEVTKQIATQSGKTVVPRFTFNEPGEKQLYLVVEDTAGHASPQYPIIIKVQ